MLVLSRKPGESIRIGEEIKITICRLGPNTVRVGIEGPQEMNIVRDELVAAFETAGVQVDLTRREAVAA